MGRKSNLSQEKLDLYNRVLETYKQEVNINPDYPFKKHCEQWDINAGAVTRWLCSRGVFISVLKQEARERLEEEAFIKAQRTGTFVSVHPETEAMTGWRNTEIPLLEIFLPGKIHLSMKKGTAADAIALISTYAGKAEKGGR